jgi:putative effector of murein hydrolase
VQAADLRSRDRAFLWPFFEARLFWEALGRYWKRILVGALVGWLVAVVGGAVILATLEYEGVMSRSTADGLGIAIVLGGAALGALIAYALRPAPRSRAANR